ncbi:DUF3667 domain-containing protein [Rufibacter sp. LB8]|uniref:DUF3667 domain-containing protein n=1 Tax=Rufibacter sp. LB8 TaxID=2777781 RepID=UPI00178C5843|nr:DUF3667 domain-containing protein [Rufibacter sp. LB8]
MAKHRRKYPVCTNCEFAFTETQPDNFCPKCGQENHDLNVPFQHVALELLEGTVHYDSKFWTTVKYLLFYPGRLTNEFHRGRRMGYVPPIRLYVFISFLFFFLLSVRVGQIKGGEQVLGSQLRKFPMQVDSLMVKAGPQATDSLRRNLEQNDLKMDSLLVADSQEELINFSTLDSIPPHASTAQLNAALTTFEVTNHTWFTRGVLQKFADFQRLTKKELVLKALKYLSIMMFVLMPLFALVLKLVFFRARRFYMEHLMFSIHLHSFLFMVMSVYLLLQFLHLPLDLEGWFFLLGLLYLFLGLKRVFKRSNLRTFGNMGLVLLLYSLVGLTTLTLGLVVSVAF